MCIRDRSNAGHPQTKRSKRMALHALHDRLPTATDGLKGLGLIPGVLGPFIVVLDGLAGLAGEFRRLATQAAHAGAHGLASLVGGPRNVGREAVAADRHGGLSISERGHGQRTKPARPGSRPRQNNWVTILHLFGHDHVMSGCEALWNLSLIPTWVPPCPAPAISRRPTTEPRVL